MGLGSYESCVPSPTLLLLQRLRLLEMELVLRLLLLGLKLLHASVPRAETELFHGVRHAHGLLVLVRRLIPFRRRLRSLSEEFGQLGLLSLAIEA